MSSANNFRVVEDIKTKRRVFYFEDTPITAHLLREIGRNEVAAALESIENEGMRDRVAHFMLHEWSFWARPEQLVPPTEHRAIVALAGRGFGKTRMGAEWVRECKRQGYAYVNLIGATLDDAVDIQVDGESGILAICPKIERPDFIRHKRQLRWPDGSISRIFTADEPERLRGKQHQKIWADELCAWRYAEAWVQMKLGLRLRAPDGAPVVTPQALVTTTPKPSKLLKELLGRKDTLRISGKTSDNIENLAPDFFSDLQTQYGGTRLGRQELDAEILMDNPGALWTYGLIETSRVEAFAQALTKDGEVELVKVHRNFRRIVVAIDPPATSTATSDECGLVVCALGEDQRGYVLEDLSGVMSPSQWGQKALEAYSRWDADRIVAEVNQGGEMVENTIRTLPGGQNASYKAVRASKGKFARAEPVSALYEQGRISHVGSFKTLEDQMVDYNPQTSKKSPDRMDALVWAFTDLMVDQDLGILQHMRDQIDEKKKQIEAEHNPPKIVEESAKVEELEKVEDEIPKKEESARQGLAAMRQGLSQLPGTSRRPAGRGVSSSSKVGRLMGRR